MAEPANRRDLPGGGKVYVHPLTGERFDSVTTVLDTWDKGNLKIWSGMVAAAAALDNLPQILEAVITPECGNTYNRCYEKHGRDATCERCPCGQCEKCWYRRIAWTHAAESGRRAQEGTECHDAIDHWVTQGGDRLTLRDEVAPYFDQFLRFVDDYGLQPNSRDGEGDWEQTEATLINREHMYAGTSDAAIWIRHDRTDAANALLDRIDPRHYDGSTPLQAALVRVDYKTREKPDQQLYLDMALQGVAYEYAPLVLLSDGREVPAPITLARMVLQLRPSSYSFVPMATGPAEFEVFLGLLTAYRWATGAGKKAFDLDTLYPAHVPDRVIMPPVGGGGVPDEPIELLSRPVSATAKQDAFELAMSGRRGRSPWPAGQPQRAGYDDEIPF